MSSLAVFEFNSKPVRVVFLKGNPWFVAKDVLMAMESTTTVTALEALISEDFGDGFVTNQLISDTIGRKQKMLCLSEPALTLFVSRSRTGLGKQLNRWMHVEVLPSIRKTGSYSRRGKSLDWIEVRQEGKDVHRTLTDAVQDYIARHPELSANKQKFMYSNVADAVNRGLFGLPSKQLKALLSLTSSQLLRDGLEKKEIHCLTAIEFLAVRYIDVEDLDPCLAVKKAIEASYTNQLFAEKYLSLKAGE